MYGGGGGAVFRPARLSMSYPYVSAMGVGYERRHLSGWQGWVGMFFAMVVVLRLAGGKKNEFPHFFARQVRLCMRWGLTVPGLAVGSHGS